MLIWKHLDLIQKRINIIYYKKWTYLGLIAMLFGIYDVHLLITIMGINACMNFFGLLQEVTILNEGN